MLVIRVQGVMLTRSTPYTERLDTSPIPLVLGALMVVFSIRELGSQVIVLPLVFDLLSSESSPQVAWAVLSCVAVVGNLIQCVAGGHAVLYHERAVALVRLYALLALSIVAARMACSAFFQEADDMGILAFYPEQAWVWQLVFLASVLFWPLIVWKLSAQPEVERACAGE